jgi:predicted ATPase
MITNFRVRNFKRLVDSGEQFRPQPLSVIIGPNDSGKSSLLQSIDFLRAFFMSSVEVYLKERGWEFKDVVNLHRDKVTIHWDLTAELKANEDGIGAGIYEYSVNLLHHGYLGINSESLAYKAAQSSPLVLLSRKDRTVETLNRKTDQRESTVSYRVPASIISTFETAADKAKYPEAVHFRNWIEGFRYFPLLDPKTLRGPDRSKDTALGPSGEGLASTLASLKQRKPDGFRDLVKRIRRLFPHVEDITILRGRQGRAIRLHERAKLRDVAFKSQQMSDGILRVLAIATLLYVDNPPSVVMFEEPENGIHPRLLRVVVQMLRELTLRKLAPRPQVIFTTHSPYVLDEFYDKPAEVFLMDRAERGSAVFELSTSHELPLVKELFSKSLGEAWFSGLIRSPTAN